MCTGVLPVASFGFPESESDIRRGSGGGAPARRPTPWASALLPVRGGGGGARIRFALGRVCPVSVGKVRAVV